MNQREFGYGIKFILEDFYTYNIGDFVGKYNQQNMEIWKLIEADDEGTIFVARHFTKNEIEMILDSVLINNTFNDVINKIVLSNQIQKLWSELLMEFAEYCKTNNLTLNEKMTQKIEVLKF